MDASQILLIAGALISLVGVVGGIVVRDRYIQRLITDGDAATRRDASAETEKVHGETKQLHERVNRVRDEYVKRVDLDSHIERLDSNIVKLGDDMRTSSERTNQRLDAVLAHLMGNHKD